MLPDVADDLEQRLCAVVARYGEPHRRHHTTAHLAAVLEEVERLLGDADPVTRDRVRLAAIFHDAVYDPRSSTNEADSAALARSVLGGVVPPAEVEEVVRLVLATASHRAAAPDEAVLVDADLAILAADDDAYDAYVRGVRAEYAHVSDEAWQEGRARVLRSFLERPRIFCSEASADREARARGNLRRELEALEGQASSIPKSR